MFAESRKTIFKLMAIIDQGLLSINPVQEQLWDLVWFLGDPPPSSILRAEMSFGVAVLDMTAEYLLSSDVTNRARSMNRK